MVPLDAFVPIAQVYCGSVALAVVASVLYGRWVQRYESEDATSKFDGAERFGWWYSVGSVTVCFIWLDGAVALRQAIGLVSPFNSASFPVVLAVSVGFVVLIALHAATWLVPLAVTRVLTVGTDETVGDHLVAFGIKYSPGAVLAVLPMTVVFSPTFDIARLLASLVAVEVLWLLLATEYTIATHRTAPPSAAERERLEAVFSDLEFDPQTIQTIALDTNRDGMILHDIPGRQLVLISEYFLSVADDDQLRVAATQVDHISRTWFREGRTAVLLGTLLTCFWLVSPLAPPSNGLGLLLIVLSTVIAGTLLWRLSGTLYRADNATADRIGARRLLEYHEWWLDVSDAKRDHGLLNTVLFSEPPAAKRIARLREMTGEEPAGSVADDSNPAD